MRARRIDTRDGRRTRGRRIWLGDVGVTPPSLFVLGGLPSWLHYLSGNRTIGSGLRVKASGEKTNSLKDKGLALSDGLCLVTPGTPGNAA